MQTDRILKETFGSKMALLPMMMMMMTMMIEAVICINQKLLSLDSLIHTNSRGGLI
jgi:hypothetical protein